MSVAPGEELWPFLVVIMSRRVADDENTRELVPRGLGWRSDGYVFTLMNTAERGDVVVSAPDRPGLPPDGRQLLFDVVGASRVVGLLALREDDRTASADARRQAVDGEACAVAMVRDFTGSVRLLPGVVEKLESDGRFTVALSGRYPEDFSASGSPVVAHDGAVIGISLGAGTNRSVEAAGIDELNRVMAVVAPARPTFELSATTRNALGYALQTARSDGSRKVGAAGALLLGVLRSTEDDRGATVPGNVLAQVAARRRHDPKLPAFAVIDSALESLGLPTTTYPPEVSDDATLFESPIAPLLDSAESIRARVAPAERLRRRFLLAAVLTQPLEDFGPSLFEALGTTLLELRNSFREAIAAEGGQPIDVWDEVLGGSIELAGGISEDRVDPTEGIPLERDHLGVGDYVTMFATIIADTQTPMPLSIGLFGEWGSGKSYFMALLRGQVAALAESGDPRYHREIVQIGFNAWHYADSNLWASLGDEIFEQLAGPGESNDARRQRLREDLAKRLQRRKELETAAEGAMEEIARLTSNIDAASVERESRAGELVKAVLGTSMFGSKLERALAELGVDDEVEQGRLLADELADTQPDLDVLRHAFRGRWWLLLALAAAALAVAVGATLSRELLAGSGLAAIAVIATTAAWLLARARSGVRLLHETAEALRRDKAAEIAPRLAELRRAEAQQQVLRAQLDEVTGQVGELGRELAELSPGQRLYRFIAERATSGSYSKQLGLISTIRKDFEQLIVLMKEWETAEPSGDVEETPEPIDRIVLYIDDLDRCSSEQVVEVLQAVHLLLALDLFVVVVGVDPRWLLHALRREYRSMLTSGSRPAGEEPWWETTPQDYLEKIFNIPFTLTRISSNSFEQLVRSLAETEPPADSASLPVTDPAIASSADPAETATEPLTAPRPASTPHTEGPVELAELPVEAESQVAALRAGVAEPTVRPLTGKEVSMLTALAPLVETPRETKRILNLYRMIRATRNLSSASSFLGDEGNPGDYQAVVILLGLLSGHGRMLENVLAAPRNSNVLGGLRFRAPDERWTDFVAGMTPRFVDPDRPELGWTNDVIGPIPKTDVPNWERLSRGLDDASTQVTIHDLRPFQRWAPRIARFSFLLSPYAHNDVPSGDV